MPLQESDPPSSVVCEISMDSTKQERVADQFVGHRRFFLHSRCSSAAVHAFGGGGCCCRGVRVPPCTSAANRLSGAYLNIKICFPKRSGKFNRLTELPSGSHCVSLFLCMQKSFFKCIIGIGRIKTHTPMSILPVCV